MEPTTPFDVLSEGAAYALYMALAVFAFITFSIISANFNKVMLIYRDAANRVGAKDKKLPSKIIAYTGIVFFIAGMTLYEPFFVGVGILSIPLIFFSLRDLNRVDPWEEQERRRKQNRPD